MEARTDSGADEKRGGFGTWFAHAATRSSETLGSVWAFVVAALVIFSDTWQLVINTSTTIVTFLRSS